MAICLVTKLLDKRGVFCNKSCAVCTPCERSDAFAAVKSGEWAGMTRPVAAVAALPPPHLDAEPLASIFIC